MNSECPASTCARALRIRGDIGGGRQAADGAAHGNYYAVDAAGGILGNVDLYSETFEIPELFKCRETLC
jgi:hypothetical protein